MLRTKINVLIFKRNEICKINIYLWNIRVPSPNYYYVLSLCLEYMNDFWLRTNSKSIFFLYNNKMRPVKFS